MHHSIILASLAALAIAVPMEMMKDMNSMKKMNQAANTEYTEYGKYGGYSKYGKYDNYPPSVEEVAQTLANANMKRNMMMADKQKDATIDAHQAEDTSYGKYGAYSKYSNYGTYPPAVGEEAAKIAMAKM